MRYLTLLAALCATLSFSQSSDAKRNVLLFVTDDQGLDAGCYGNPVIQTPHLDALAADGTRFDNAYCTTASCSPSRSAMLTGMYPHSNGMYGLEHSFHHFSSFGKLESLPVWLSEAGYRTARIGKFHVGPEDVYRFDKSLPGDWRSSVEMAENCRQVIEDDSDSPFFLYFCVSDPHRGGGVVKKSPHKPDRFGNKPAGKQYPGVEPVHYDPAEVIVPPFLPDTPACRAELAQYYESISRADAGLGRLVEILKSADKYDDTLIIFVSDNGSPFPGAKTTLYEAGIHLPCVVRAPGAPRRGVVNKALISWIDLAPTILEFAGVEPPRRQKLQGRSFLPIVAEESPDGWDELYATHTLHEVTKYYPVRAVRSGRYKLIWNIAHPLEVPIAGDLRRSTMWQQALEEGDDYQYGKRSVEELLNRPRFELYDLENDPHEAKNLADQPEHKELLTKLQTKLRDFQKRTSDPWEIKWEQE